MTTKLLYLFTRTPLHIGTGASVGAIDQPIQRERHTGFPIIPGSSLKGSFADQWPVKLKDKDNNLVRLTTKQNNDTQVIENIDESGAAWLFGSGDAHVAFAGSLLFSVARILAFPIRSARGSFAWITCPLALQRALRDGIELDNIPREPEDNQAIFKADKLAIDSKIVLEEYCFESTDTYPQSIATKLKSLVNDSIFNEIEDRLVILSNGVFTHFVNTACEIAQHVRISDETGTAEEGGLFNQENVPSETLFYSVIHATKSRVPSDDYSSKTSEEALIEFATKLQENIPFQFGANASTGLGFCSLTSNIQTQD